MVRSVKRKMALLVVLAAIMLPGIVWATPVVWWQQGGGPLHYVTSFKDYQDGTYSFDFNTTGPLWAVQGNVVVDADPYIAWGLSVANNTGAPMDFTTGVLNTFFAPITTPNTVYGSFSGSVTDIMGDGVTVAPINPFIQTTSLNGPVNMGVDVGGLYQVGPGVPGKSYDIPVAAEGPKAGPIGVWTSMELVAAFTLSSHDIATVNGYSSITPVPEPGTLLLLGGGLLGLAVWKRRRHG